MATRWQPNLSLFFIMNKEITSRRQQAFSSSSSSSNEWKKKKQEDDDELDLLSFYVATHEKHKLENEDELGGSSLSFDLLL